jgi:hypothetical protein
MSIVPARFLFRICRRCQYAKAIPRQEKGEMLELEESCRLENFAGMDAAKNFADVRIAWNELGIGVQTEVRGKEQTLQGDESRPRASDGLTVWIDTRDARTTHRASRYCHQFHLLPAGGGPDRDEPVCVQAKINRALHDAPTAPTNSILVRAAHRKGGYFLEAFLSASALHGFDPEQNRRMGVYYVVRDAELGEQVLSVGPEFPYWEDPSLWSVLELAR